MYGMEILDEVIIFKSISYGNYLIFNKILLHSFKRIALLINIF